MYGSETRESIEDLAPEYRYMVNERNVEKVHGWLVVEIIPDDLCCVPTPKVGMRIRMIGSWVIDTVHGWAELHPVWHIEHLN